MRTETTTRKIDLRAFVKTPFDIVSIEWEVDGSSGSTQCEAWRGQYDIDCLMSAGYQIIRVGLHK